MKSNRWISIVLIIIGACSYGMLSPFIKLAYDAGLSEGHTTLTQATMGTLVLWVLVGFARGARHNPFRGPWIKLCLIGIFGLAATTVFYNASLNRLNASLSIVLLFQFTWITILMECISSKKRLTLYQLAAIITVLVGTILAVNILDTDLGSISLTGIALGLAAACTYSLFLFTAGKVESDHHPIMKSALMQTAGLLAIIVVYPPTDLTVQGSGELILWGLLLGMLGQVIPTICFLIGIPRVGSGLAAMLGSMELPAALIGAFFILNEDIGGGQWLGMLLILAGILVSEKKRKAKVHESNHT